MEVDNEQQLKELKRVASAEQDFRVRRGWVGDCPFSVSLAELSDFKNGHNNYRIYNSRNRINVRMGIQRASD